MTGLTDQSVGALDGIKVLDLSRVLAGPWCAMTLADLGAEVWKIEHPDIGDETRSWSPPSVDGISTYFLTANRNKSSVAMNIKDPRCRRALDRLIEQADVLIENFRTSSAKSLGLDYASTSKINPGLVHCSISGYGRTGDFADRPGYDFVLQAQCGFMSITGEVEGDPMRSGVAFIDLVTGMNAIQGILAALIARGRTNEGQHVDIALHDCGLQFLANVASGVLNTGSDSKRFGNAHPSVVPYQLFYAQNGEPFALAIGNNGQFRRLCVHVLDDLPMSEDPKFASNEARVRNRDELIPRIQAGFRQKPLTELMALLQAHDIPGGEVRTVQEALNSKEADARDIVTHLPHASLGHVAMVKSPLNLSDTPVREGAAAPLLGEHTRDVLMRDAAVSENDWADMLRDGVVGVAQAPS